MTTLRNDSIYRNRNFLLLWLGQLVSAVGSRMHAIAVMWYVLEVTSSTTKAGITLVFTVVPSILLSPITGSLADRLDRKKIIVYSDFVNGILVGVISILIYTGNMELWMLYSISALMSVANAFFGPAISAAIPSIVRKENLIKANSLAQITRYSTSIFGPALGGILIAIIGIPGLFLLDSISFLMSAFSESFMSIPKVVRDKNKKSTIKEDILEGIKYTLKNKDLLHIIIVGGVIINFFFAPLSLIIAVLSKNILNVGIEGYGILLTAMSIGGLIMSLIVPKISKKIGNYKLMFLGLTFEGLLLIPLAFSKNMYTAMISLIILGCSFGVVNVSLGTVIQTIVPNNIMGRVSSVFGILCQSTTPLGYFLGGVLLESYSVSSLCIVSGVIVAIAGFTTIRVSRNDSIKENVICNSLK